MATEPTDGNPTGIATFDHGRIAGLPEYQAAGRALDALIHSMVRADANMTVQEFRNMALEVVASLAFGDECERCGVITFPFAAEVETPADGSAGSLTARYCCDNGHTWPCGWTTNAPLFS